MCGSNSSMESALWEPTPIVFLFVTFLLIVSIEWPQQWLFSGAPILTSLILHGARLNRRMFPSVNLWAIVSTLNLLYAISATSWLLYWIFTLCCYTTIFMLSLLLFRPLASAVRGGLRRLLKQMHFTSDKVAFFDLPSLKIDTDIDGLMALRGVTISFSTLTAVVHGVELGIKLSDDLELAIQTERVTISLLRSIEIGDVYANLKGGQYELLFGSLAENTQDADGNAVMMPQGHDEPADGSLPNSAKIPMTEHMTNGEAPEYGSPMQSLRSIISVSPGEEYAGRRYSEVLAQIDETCTIRRSELAVRQSMSRLNSDSDCIDGTDKSEMRAAICSQLHNAPTVPHPRRRSIKVTTLQTLTPPYIRKFLHRLPMLLRLLLNILSYAHTISISSITASGSGQWMQQAVNDKVFQDYIEESSELRSLHEKVTSWLHGASFVVDLSNIAARAHVPFLTSFKINTHLNFKDVKLHKALPSNAKLKEVIHIGGAEAAVSVPSYLLPHHEHLLPTVPTMGTLLKKSKEINQVHGMANELRSTQDLEQTKKDETNITVSARVRLPVSFDQELLDFIAALVKATKVIEIEKDPSAFDEDIHGIKEFSKAVHDSVKESIKKKTVEIAINDRWIAKMVGKLMKGLETAQGNVGYSMEVPVPLKPYRDAAEPFSKLLA